MRLTHQSILSPILLYPVVLIPVTILRCASIFLADLPPIYVFWALSVCRDPGLDSLRPVASGKGLAGSHIRGATFTLDIFPVATTNCNPEGGPRRRNKKLIVDSNSSGRGALFHER